MLLRYQDQFIADVSAGTVQSRTATTQEAGRPGKRPLLLACVLALLWPAGWVFAQADPGSTSTLRLVSGTVNGQSLSPSNRSVTVDPGTTLTGSFTVQINSTWDSNAVMAMGATPTWGAHSTSYIDLSGFSTPVSGLTRSVPVNWQAPSTPGTYYIVAAFRAEFTAEQVMSSTNWGAGSAVWNDGNDVADWSSTTIETAISYGTIQVPYRFSTGIQSMFVPSTAIRILVSNPDPGSSSSLRLVSGTVNGQSLSPSNRSVTVDPGATLTGSFTVQINSTWDSNAVMAMGATPTWGSHSTSYIDLGGFSTPVSGQTRSVPVNWQAPSTPGTYYIVVAFRAEFTAEQVMSSTNWGAGSAVWNDGNDVADWSSTTIETAISNGTVQAPILFSTGTQSMYVPSTAIKIVVIPCCIPDDPGKTSPLWLVSGTVNGQPLSPSNRTVTVDPGAMLSGSFTVQINSTWPSNAVMAMGATPTWGSHSTSYIDLTRFSTPVNGLTRSVPVNWKAPMTPGTYYIVAAFRAEYTADQVMSCTNWGVGSAVWNDGNDVADWSSSTIETAIGNGTTQVPYRFSTGIQSTYVPSTAIRIVVGWPDQATSLTMVSGNSQPAAPNAPFANPLVVRVSDASGDPVAHAALSWSVTAGSASISSASAVTGADGRGQALVTAGSQPGPVEITVTVSSLRPVVFSLTVSFPPPVLSFANGADGAIGVIAPCGLARISGVQGSPVSASVGPMPYQLAGVSVLFDNHPAPMHSATNDSVTVQVPCDVRSGVPIPVTVWVNGTSTTMYIALLTAGPGIFHTPDANGVLRPVAVRPDGTFVSPDNPARRGERVRVYVTGLGPASPALTTNAIPPNLTDPLIRGQIIVGLNNAGVVVLSSRASADLAGVSIVEFLVPADAATGAKVPFIAAVIPPDGATMQFSNGTAIAIGQ